MKENKKNITSQMAESEQSESKQEKPQAPKPQSWLRRKIGTGLDKFYALLNTKKQLLLFLAFWSVLLNYLLESSLRKNFLLGFVHILAQPLVFAFNSLLIFAFFSLLLLLKRRLFGFTVLNVVFLTLAITNYIVLLSRNTPLNAPDFRIIKSAFGVVTIYLNIFEQILVVLLILLGLSLLAFTYFKGRLSERDMSFSLPTFAIVCCVTLSSVLLYSHAVITAHFSDLPNAYKEYGFTFSFLCSVVDRGIDKPDNYTDESLETLKVSLDDHSETKEHDSKTPENTVMPSEVTPNIIFLQLESFYDPTNIEDLHFNEDPIPVFHSLQENYPSGKLTVPSIGAGTANTEFEVITGMDLDYFGVAEYPYLSVLQDNTCESVAYDLKAYGYAAHAMHNHTGSFYDRHKVFPNLGFDTFTSIENMQNIRRNERGWAKDAMLADEIKGVTASTPNQADLVYAISVQGHGKYPVSIEEFNELYPSEHPAHIRVTGNETDPEKPGVDYWVNQVHDMDAFLGSLVSEFAASKEPTVIIMYGDHLPSFTLDNWKIKDGNLYQTQFVIWSNFDLPEKNAPDMHSFELSSYIMRMFGFESGYINRLHQKYYANGKDYSAELHLLQYDLLYGGKKIYGGADRYLPTNIRYGYRDITISSIAHIGNNIFVYGENFNEYSHIYVNGSKKQTSYIDNGCVSAGNIVLHTGDRIKIVQVTTDLVEVGESDIYVISENEADVPDNWFHNFFSIDRIISGKEEQ